MEKKIGHPLGGVGTPNPDSTGSIPVWPAKL